MTENLEKRVSDLSERVGALELRRESDVKEAEQRTRRLNVMDEKLDELLRMHTFFRALRTAVGWLIGIFASLYWFLKTGDFSKFFGMFK